MYNTPTSHPPHTHLVSVCIATPRLQANPRYLSDLLERHILNNNHRLTLHLRPSVTVEQTQEVEEAARLAEAAKAMSAADIEKLEADNAALEAWQSTPDSPEAQATIPVLKLSDISEDATEIPQERSALPHDGVMLQHEQPTNGVVHVKYMFDGSHLPRRLMPLLPLWCRCITSLGTDTVSEEMHDLRMDRDTGGIQASFTAGPIGHGRGAVRPVLSIGGRALRESTQPLLDILEDVAQRGRADLRERLLAFTKESIAHLEAGTVSSGHATAMRELAAQLTLAGKLSADMSGVAYLRFLRRLEASIQSDWASVEADLHALRSHLVSQQNLVVSVTGDATTLAESQGPIQALAARLPEKAATSDEPVILKHADPPSVRGSMKGLLAPTQVNYVGWAMPAYFEGEMVSGDSLVVTKSLRTAWLWEQVRVQGGAYGAMCSLDPFSGVMSFASYRDPNLDNTLRYVHTRAPPVYLARPPPCSFPHTQTITARPYKALLNNYMAGAGTP